MAGMQFEYDEEGGTFYYFLLSFLALVLCPATYYLWPGAEKKGDTEKTKRLCHCDPCQVKHQRVQRNKPWRNLQRRAIKCGLLFGWVLFVVVAYKASQVKLDYKEFDPFAELEIDRGATEKEIKKAYRRLALVYHPDRETGDETKFIRLKKAHQILVDDEARENWEKWGNPDGQGVTHYGIALPKWIVEKQNSMFVLAVYALVFMVILPVAVGMWWYKSIKYSAEQILMDTAKLYYIFLKKTPNMTLRRVLMVLGGSFEFDRYHNSEIIERETDDTEIPQVMRELPNLGEKNKERPICAPYSMKARTVIFAQLMQVEIGSQALLQDQSYVIKKCPYLLAEMINIATQLISWAHASKHQEPGLDTIENMMKASQMVVQGLWEKKHPMLQLPHINEEFLRHFITKKRHVRSIRDFVRLNDADRRMLLRNMTEAEYQDVINVVASMPRITMNVEPKVLDDDDPGNITAGAIVTLVVDLKRDSLETEMDGLDQEDPDAVAGIEELNPDKEEEDDDEAQNKDEETPKKKPSVWEKNKKKKGKAAAKAKKKPVKPVKPAAPLKKTNASNSVVPATGATEGKPEEEEEHSPDHTPTTSKSRQKREVDGEEGDHSSEADSSAAEDSDDESVVEKRAHVPEEVRDEQEWSRFQQESKKENLLEAKSKETHAVHCPSFPNEKYEWWWLYVVSKASKTSQRRLVTSPMQVCSLKNEDEIQLKFPAPPKAGTYKYSVILRSDSYLDFDKIEDFKLDVRESKKVEKEPQWDFTDDEEGEDKGDDDDSDYSGDSDYETEDN